MNSERCTTFAIDTSGWGGVCSTLRRIEMRDNRSASRKAGACILIMLAALAFITALSSCTEKVIVPISEWKITITHDPTAAGMTEEHTLYSYESYALPVSESDGYVLESYTDDTGRNYLPGDVIHFNGKNRSFVAHWAVETIIEPSAPGEPVTGLIKDAIDAASGRNIIINLPSSAGTEYSEPERIVINPGQSVTINGPEAAGRSRTASRSASTTAPVLDGSFELSEGSSLTINNIRMTSSTDKDLIFSESGDIEINVYDSVLTAYPNSNAIGINISENPSSTVRINIEGSLFELTAGVGNSTSNVSRGLFVRGDSTQMHKLEDQLDMAEISIIDTEMKQISNDGDYLIIPIDIQWVDDMDISLDDVDISINKNYYALRFYGVGTENTEPQLRIKDSTLKAWSALYIQGDSKNIHAEVDRSTLTGINLNSGTTNDFGTIAINSSCHNIINLNRCTIAYSAQGNANQSAASIYHWDHTGMEGGNEVNFNGCDFDFSNGSTTPVITFGIEIIMTRSGREINGYSYINLDSATLSALENQGYKLTMEEEKKAIDPSYGADVEGFDEDGYKKIPYAEWPFTNPSWEGGGNDGEAYQFIQQDYFLKTV